MRLQGKTALITAAGQGMGRAAAEAFLREGARVFATDIDENKLGGLDGATCFPFDVTKAEHIGIALARTGSVDVLFNCAGYVANGSVLECPVEDWDFSFELNVRSMFRVIQAYLPGMIDAGGGRIINMASVASSVKGIKSRAAYSASKAAVIGLTKSIAADYVANGIRCNALCPGTVDTPSLQDRIDAYEDPVEARKMFIARQPMGRLATAQEVVEMVVYLASDAADFVTGQTMIVDGGICI
ncbi:MAG TPA: SDR family oxidoreductase [Alphaproteobacteria bacterium]|nr:SDR family oxidoreductase [Alphaproteobacteria bacterium]HIC71827.1 SDR family oxidoreductase [Alphaproteobacteria bacterium]